MINTSPALTPEQIKPFYESAFAYYSDGQPIPAIEIIFYPYIGLNQTIRVRRGKVFVRISELCRDMPVEAHKALARILVAKLFGRRVPRAADRIYSAYTQTADVRDRASESHRMHGRKLVTTSKGTVYDLDEIFDDLNFWYFGEKLKKPTMSWSARETYRILGHHDSTHDTIVVSRSLDSEDVPPFVVEYIVFHEMLHIHHPTVHHNGRRFNHTPEFRRDEERYRHYRAAEEWIEQNVGRLKRRVRARRRVVNPASSVREERR